MFTVTHGTNLGDAISYADELELADTYVLSARAQLSELAFQIGADECRIDATSKVGTPGAALYFDCVLTLMSSDGQTSDAMVLVQGDEMSNISEIFLLPLGPMIRRTDYVLIRIDRDASADVLAQAACARFLRGTHITLASGMQVPIEELSVGDKVLSRDAGPQPIRWIGSSTVRANGAFAPIRISAGVLHNTRDLIVSPEHRLFVYQRSDRLGAGRSELLIKARHLVNGDTVTVQQGGFVDYFQLLFDMHQIIYAEGIAAESTLIDTHTRSSVPEEVAQQVTPGTRLPDIEASKTLLARPDVAEILRKASRE